MRNGRHRVAELGSGLVTRSLALSAVFGTPVYFHVHNHGFNTFKLLAVDLVLPAE